MPQAANLLSQIDKALQAAPTREEALNAVTNPQTRRQLVTTIVLLGLLFLGGKYELDTYNNVTVFQGKLSSSAQTSFSELSYLKQIELITAVEKLNISPQAVEFFLIESARPNSVLVDLSLTDALRVSPILQDYIARYGYNEALHMASPEVIMGLENSRFLVQAQDIISQDAGYNITPEYVFTDYPESTIGVNSTFITNKASITKIIGDFNGAQTVYITLNETIALEKALGLKVGTLAKGFRISKISNLDGLNLSYPLKGTEPYFLGPGKGLPGGGTEIIVNPPVPMNSPYVVDQINVKVYP